jgi:hypothetical protein
VPSWLIVPVLVTAGLVVAWRVENRVALIVAELKAIRENLDRLWADRPAQEGEIETRE